MRAEQSKYDTTTSLPHGRVKVAIKLSSMWGKNYNEFEIDVEAEDPVEELEE